jgi:hypothetical protein
MTPRSTTPNGTFNLATDAVLVRTIIGRAGAKAKSKTLQREAAATHHADLESLDMKVSKLARAALDTIVKLESAARAAFYFGTVRWDDNAYRLVPATRFAALMVELNDFKNRYYDAAEELVAQQAELAADFRKRVGPVLAAETRFPSAAELRASYRFEIRTMPLADPNDLRLRHVDPRVVDDIKASVNAAYAERLVAAQQEVIERLRERVAAIKDALSRKKGRLHDSLTANLDKEIEALPHLNITNDPEIARLIERVRAELGGLELAELKDSPKDRRATAKVASTVLDDLKNFGLK